jgi:hypothetical protein
MLTMTIWLLAAVLLASVAALGYRQGAVRVAFSFLGILFGALLAVPLGRFAGRLLVPFGVKDPLVAWLVGPLIVFVLFSVIFKVAAASVHHKVEVYYKYHAGDLRTALWERLNHPLGLCLGVLNGAAYLVLLAFALYVPSYLTFQVASSDADPGWMRLLNRLGADLQNTGFDKVARSLDSIPALDYKMADFAGLLYRNPLAEARLSSYPAVLGLAELPEFQQLGTDRDFTEAWQRQEPVMSLLEKPKILAIRSNPELLKKIWTSVAPDLDDLEAYLKTGRSAKYDPIQILGRWQFDVGAAIAAIRRAKPNMYSSEMHKIRNFMQATFTQTGLIAKPDNQVTFKNMPTGKIAPGVAAASLQPTVAGTWKEAEGKYLLSFSGTELPATIEGDRLTIKGDGLDLVFDRED